MSDQKHLDCECLHSDKFYKKECDPSLSFVPINECSSLVVVCQTDVLLVIDTSSFALPNINQLLDLVTDITDNLVLGNTRFAAMSFGSFASAMFNFNVHFNRNSLKAAIQNAPRIGGITDFVVMLDLAESIISSPQRGNRDNVRDVVLVFTYGYDTAMTFSTSTAQEIADQIVRDDNANLICK